LFESGESSLFEVLTAQRSLYSARDALAQSSVALATQYIALCKALGGGWDLSTGGSRLKTSEVVN
jgi:multidrug efflux system outer membrane protein